MIVADAPALRVSVVIALNPHDHDLGAIFDALVAQRGAGAFEVLVTDDGSRPDAAATIAAFRLRHPGFPLERVVVDRRGRGAGNNAGAAAGRGDLIVFLADDFRAGPNLVAAHRAFHAGLAGPAVGVGASFFPARLRADPFRRWLEDSGRLYGVPFRRCPPAWSSGFFFVGNASVSRALFERIGPFDDSGEYDLFEDDAWRERLADARIPTHYLPRAWAWHEHEQTIDERRLAIERLGAAARRHEAVRPGPHAWSALAARSLALLRAEAEALAHAAAGTRSLARQGRAWAADLDYVFASGYHAEAARANTRAAD